MVLFLKIGANPCNLSNQWSILTRSFLCLCNRRFRKQRIRRDTQSLTRLERSNNTNFKFVLKNFNSSAKAEVTTTTKSECFLPKKKYNIGCVFHWRKPKTEQSK